MSARRLIVALAIAWLAVSGSSQRAAADPAITGYPDSIAGLGDSMTRAHNSDAYGDRPENSWVTGTNPSVNTYYSRLLAAHPAITGNRYNLAVSGAQMDDLPGQAANAVSAGADAISVLMGANDVCTPSEASMTSVASFQANFEAAMDTLTTGLPDSRIAVLSVPDIHNLWEILKDDPGAQGLWAFAGICQSMLANPTSMAPADVQRRANVSQRNQDFNDVLHDVCAQYAHCKFDDYLGYNTAYAPEHVSTLDYFHPSIAGQALIAQVAWDFAFDWSDTTPPVSSSSATAVSGGANVSFSATDAAGVLGIEYRTTGAWQTYAGTPVNFASGALVTWRAVDDNGNTEATHTCRVATWSWASGDADCDGYTTATETALGTDANDACGFTPGAPNQSETWPPDLVESNTINISDVLALKPVFNTAVPPTSARYDVVPSASINISDILALKPFFNTSCTP